MFSDPSFWVAVAFFGFIIGLFKPIKKALLNTLDSRSNMIRKELNEALRLKEEALTLLQSVKNKKTDAEKHAKIIIEEAQQEALAIAAKADKDIENSLNQRIDLAKQKIASYEALILQDIRNHAMDIMMSTVRRIISENISTEMAKELVASSAAEINKKLN